MEEFIQFLIKNNERIIYISIGMISLLSGVVVWWQIFSRRDLDSPQKAEVDLSGIEESLKKILSQTNAAIGSVDAAGQAAGSGPSTLSSGGNLTEALGSAGITTLDGKTPVMDLAGLKVELQSRANMIEELSRKVAEAKASDGTSSELTNKIKSLESKLSEYEIIEDDIADLSNFKEENARLKKEIEELKRGGGGKLVDQFAAAMGEAATPAVESAAPELAPVPTPVAEAPTPPPAVSSPPPTAAAPSEVATVNPSEAELNDAIEDLADQMEAHKASKTLPPIQEMPSAMNDEEVAAAVAQVQAEIGMTASGSTPESAAIEPAAEEPAETEPPKPARESQPTEQRDVFEEFAGTSDTTTADPLAALGDIDPDRMLDELKGLNAEMGNLDVLNESTDVDKMAKEVTQMKR